MLVVVARSLPDHTENYPFVLENKLPMSGVFSACSQICAWLRFLFNIGNPKQMTVLDNMVCAVGKHAKEHLLNKQFLLFLKALRFFPLLYLERSKTCNTMAWKYCCPLTTAFFS